MKLYSFSFHGKKIFYVTEPNGELWAMNIDGTEETKICEKEIIKNEDISYRRISRDDEKLLTKLNEDLWIINTSNNSKECITKEIKDKLGFNIPWEPFSPDGRLVLFYIFYSSSQNNGYYILDLKTSKLLQLNGSSKLNLTDATWIG
jgi:WD40 repeat protein